jgi:hypothetical protein
MHRLTPSALILVAIAGLASGAVPAAAAPPAKVWVSNTGIDNSSCGAITSPCRTFQQAHDNVAAGGEISVLTPGDYVTGPALSITKSVSITNDGTGEASIFAPGFTGIYINAGPGDVISLRGLVLDGSGSSSAFGIYFNAGSALHIQNCVIRNYEGNPGIGIEFAPIANSKLFISDTIIFNNGGVSNSGGILILPQSTASAAVVLDRLHLENNVFGIKVDGSLSSGSGSHVVVRDSVVSGNVADGIVATTTTGHAPSFVVLERTSAVNNAGNGILADGPHATVLLDGMVVVRNGTGINAVSGGQLISYGNNRVNNNLGSDGTPTGTYSPL